MSIYTDQRSRKKHAPHRTAPPKHAEACRTLLRFGSHDSHNTATYFKARIDLASLVNHFSNSVSFFTLKQTTEPRKEKTGGSSELAKVSQKKTNRRPGRII